jgi:undecaprenyl diphosphate synthase
VSRGELSPEAIDQGELEAELDTVGIPDPDVILRTSGEQRVSNFLLWQGAYAELIFLPVLWPDFGDADFEAALEAFASRERRYGGVVAA